MKLNADIGESFGKWTLGDDEQIMPLLDQANIACGYHAGDALTMQKTIALAAKHKVDIGAHVAYPDLQGFGRRSMGLSHSEVVAIIHAQMATLEGMAKCQSVQTSYVKPHGALYNDMMQNLQLFESIVVALATYHRPHSLVVQALPDMSLFIDVAKKYSVKLSFEAFADRAYTASGLLLSRNHANAVLNETECLRQVTSMLSGGKFLSACNTPILLTIDTICIHSDTPHALHLGIKIREMIHSYEN